MTRSELYTLVWAEPLRLLGPRLGFSDNGLLKICARYKIPTPKRGWWAKKYAGMAPDPPALPSPEENTFVAELRAFGTPAPTKPWIFPRPVAALPNVPSDQEATTDPQVVSCSIADRQDQKPPETLPGATESPKVGGSSTPEQDALPMPVSTSKPARSSTRKAAPLQPQNAHGTLLSTERLTEIPAKTEEAHKPPSLPTAAGGGDNPFRAPVSITSLRCYEEALQLAGRRREHLELTAFLQTVDAAAASLSTSERKAVASWANSVREFLGQADPVRAAIEQAIRLHASHELEPTRAGRDVAL